MQRRCKIAILTLAIILLQGCEDSNVSDNSSMVTSPKLQLSYPVLEYCKEEILAALDQSTIEAVFQPVLDPLTSHPEVVGFVTLSNADSERDDLANAFFTAKKECYPLTTASFELDQINLLPGFLTRLMDQGAVHISVRIDDDKVMIHYRELGG